ncbi:MAG: hypothetical protein WBW93_16390 [Steroidobacteraceae bacterium]
MSSCGLAEAHLHPHAGRGRHVHQRPFVHDAIASGCLQREEDAVRETMALWERRERGRAQILAAIDAAEASLARGTGRATTPESLRQLAGEVKKTSSRCRRVV